MSWFGPQHVDLPAPPPLPMFTSQTTTFRGTLTLLAEGVVIVGCPDGVSNAERDEITALVSHWASQHERKTLVLPWPVDVSDLRPWNMPDAGQT